MLRLLAEKTTWPPTSTLGIQGPREGMICLPDDLVTFHGRRDDVAAARWRWRDEKKRETWVLDPFLGFGHR